MLTAGSGPLSKKPEILRLTKCTDWPMSSTGRLAPPEQLIHKDARRKATRAADNAPLRMAPAPRGSVLDLSTCRCRWDGPRAAPGSVLCLRAPLKLGKLWIMGRSPRLRLAGSFYTSILVIVLALGCTPAPLRLMQRGRLLAAYEEAIHAEPQIQQQVAQAIIADENPVLELKMLSGEELAQTVGPYTARTMAPAWFLLRATLTSRGRAFRYANFDLAFDRDAGRTPSVLPSVPIETKELVAMTGEAIPKPQMVSDYESPLCRIPLVCVVLTPIAVMTTQKVGEHLQFPRAEEIRRSAPAAARLAELLRGRCKEPGHCVHHVLIRRPRNEAEPLALRVLVRYSPYKDDTSGAFADFPGRVGATATVALPAGPTLATRIPKSVALTALPTQVELASLLNRKRLVDYFQLVGPANVVASDRESPELVPLNAPPLPPPFTPPANLSPAAAAKLPAVWMAAIDAVDLTEDRLKVLWLDTSKLDHDNELGLDRRSLTQARAAVAELAQLVGAGQPQVRELEERIDRIENGAQAQRAQAMLKYQFRQPRCLGIEWDFKLVTIEEGRCSPATPSSAASCAYPMQVRALGQRESRFYNRNMYVLLSDGRLVQPEFVPYPVVLPPEVRELTATLKVTMAPSRFAPADAVVPQTLIFSDSPVSAKVCALTQTAQ